MAIERVIRSVTSLDSGVQLSYRHSGGAWVDPHNRQLDELSFRELLAFAGFEGPEIEAFSDRRAIHIMSNGWQSWSPAWELRGREAIGRAGLIRKFQLYTDRPRQRPRRGLVQSHFFTYLRSGSLYVGIFSRNDAGAPVGFCLNRKLGSIRIDIASAGKERTGGAPLADLHVLWGRSYFEFKDKIAALYAGFGHFERLAFLRAKQDKKLCPGGWESWYCHYSRIDEELVLKSLEALDGNQNFLNRFYVERGKPTVFQVDDGWEIAVGDWDFSRERFPNGMKPVADTVKAKGFLPGIWIAPFLVTKFSRIFHDRPDWLLYNDKGKPLVVGWMPAWGGDFYVLDLSRREVRDYLYAIFERLVNEWGFRYLKLDFLYAGLYPGRFAEGGSAYQWYEEVIGRITSVTENRDGRPVAYLGCGAPLETSFRHFPLMRIGPDTKESWDHPTAKIAGYAGRPSAWLSMRSTIGRSLLDQTVFINDPDVFFLRKAECSLSQTEKELLAVVNFLFGSQLMVSDDLHHYSDEAEGSFTAHIVDIFDKLSHDDYGAERLAKDVWRVSSRSGEIDGIVNLSDKVWKSRGRVRMETNRPIVSHIVKDTHGLAFERRSVSLFTVTPPIA